MTDATPDAARRDADAVLLSMLRCPVTREPLTREGDGFITPSGRRYPVVDGLPILTPNAARSPAQPPAATGSAGDS